MTSEASVFDHLDDLEIFTPHSEKQYRIITSEAKITGAVTGIQYGKSTAGALWLKCKMHQFMRKEDAFILAAPNYKIMQQSSLPAFLKVMEGCGRYDVQKACFETEWGSKCYMRTGTDPDSVVGITNVRGIWVDEAGLLSLYFWENLQTRASFKDAPICITTSPYTMNWVYKDIIRAAERGAQHINLIQAASWENPFFPKTDIERRRATMDPRRFQAVYGGQFSKMEGLVYGVFDERIHVIDPFELPPGTFYVGGIDWGFTEPFVLKVRAITPDNRHYTVSEFYRSGMRQPQIVDLCRQKNALYNFRAVYCGPDRPENILELCSNGIPALAAENNIRLGIERHYELIASGRFKMFRGVAPYTIDELESYHYPAPEDADPDQNVKDQLPVQQNDHALDADRYISVMTHTGGAKRKPTAPNDGERKKVSEHDRILQLMRNKSNKSEVWS
jgi:PBSX family phage terminase large subunit